VRFSAALTPLLCLTIGIAVTGCFSAPRREAPEAPAAPVPVPPPPPAADAGSVPDAVPRVEPRSRYGNPPFYTVFGQRYYVLSTNIGYIERGVASWYGPGFHKIRTSTGETYDMYAMTAAHKTLPLPAYVRVTNLQNGRSIVVRVNDRGPFVGNRIIDLSYSAAVKLDMIHNGTAFVEVRSIDPTAMPAIPPTLTASTTPAAPAIAAAPAASAPTTAAPNTPTIEVVPVATAPAQSSPPPVASAAPAQAPVKVGAPLFVQAGAFGDPANAQRLAQKLQGGTYGKVFVRDDQIAGRRMYRVRIGPVPSVAEFDRIVAALERDGVHDAHLALD
jgi:rare lipoprotein A